MNLVKPSWPSGWLLAGIQQSIERIREKHRRWRAFAQATPEGALGFSSTTCSSGKNGAASSHFAGESVELRAARSRAALHHPAGGGLSGGEEA